MSGRKSLGASIKNTGDPNTTSKPRWKISGSCREGGDLLKRSWGKTIEQRWEVSNYGFLCTNFLTEAK